MTKAREISFCGVLIALALGLSYAERWIPLQMVVPLPGIKLGLANVVTLVALCLMKKRYVTMILLCRCVLGAMFGGGITGLMFSLTGGMLALGAMILCGKAGIFSVYGISIVGAALHNVGQILVAMVLMHSVYVGAYLPYLLLTAVVTGTVTGGITLGGITAQAEDGGTAKGLGLALAQAACRTTDRMPSTKGSLD